MRPAARMGMKVKAVFMAKYKTVLLGGGLVLVGACGDSASVGENNAFCVGEKISCELPKEAQSPASDDQVTEVMPSMGVLEAAWSIPLSGSIAAGTNGTVWEVSLAGSSYHVRQIQADGTELGALDVPAPEAGPGCTFELDQAIVSQRIVTSSPGPLLVADWQSYCDGRTADYRLELVSFGATVQEGPTRTLLHRDNPTVMPPYAIQRLSNAKDYAVLSMGNGVIPSRIDGHGELLWQQSATGPVTGPLDTAGGLRIAFDAANQLALVGRFGPPDLITHFTLDWDTGNVVSQHAYYLPWSQYRVAVDSRGRSVVAATNSSGDIEWLRSDGTTTDGVTMVRSSYTLMDPYALEPDALGGTYLLTRSGERGAEQPTVCRWGDAGTISCAVMPMPNIFELAVSDQPGVLYAVHTDPLIQQKPSLVRYDFPL
ncbi:MAG: hypothetical protein QM778_21400 [Myxococcales bacterium]